jgi:hypothetical protein
LPNRGPARPQARLPPRPARTPRPPSPPARGRTRGPARRPRSPPGSRPEPALGPPRHTARPEVRCAGVRAPAKTSSTTRSAEPSRSRASASRASATWTGTFTPRGSGRAVRTAAATSSDTSTARWREPGRVAPTYRASVSAPAPRCTTRSGAPASAARSTTWPSRRTYSNARYVGSARSTCDCGVPSTESSQPEGRSPSGSTETVTASPWSTGRR